MKPFTVLTGIVAPLEALNVDTDQIIPKQFLKRIERTGYENFLFYDWRFREDGSINPDFEMNAARYRGASILLTKDNFGCGSSREHAPWALGQLRLPVHPGADFRGHLLQQLLQQRHPADPAAGERDRAACSRKSAPRTATS